MKRVFTNSDDVIHLFAQRTQSDARCGNVFFYGDKIYSYGYHYLLAEFLDDKTIMINDTGYSVTTSKHISQVSWGTKQYKQFFKTKTDLKLIVSEVKHNLDKLASARKPELYINKILPLWDSLHEYLRYTKTLTKAKKNKDYKWFAKVIDKIHNDYDDYLKSLSDAKREADQRRKVKEAKILEEKLKKFYNHDINTFRVGDEDFIRLSLDMDEVETSQGVKIEKTEAMMLYRLIQLGKDIKGHRIGHYTVTSINGTLKVGCHNINMESVHRVGKQLLN
jgi:hypothetical protein